MSFEYSLFRKLFGIWVLIYMCFAANFPKVQPVENSRQCGPKRMSFECFATQFTQRHFCSPWFCRLLRPLSSTWRMGRPRPQSLHCLHFQDLRAGVERWTRNVWKRLKQSSLPRRRPPQNLTVRAPSWGNSFINCFPKKAFKQVSSSHSGVTVAYYCNRIFEANY